MLLDFSQIKNGDDVRAVVASLQQGYAALSNRVTTLETELGLYNQNTQHVVGMVLLEEGGRVGKWVRVDANFNTVDFNPEHGTWAGMKTVVNEHGEFVEIPTTWVKTEVLNIGPYIGKTCWWISDEPTQGFHVHPAFLCKDGSVGSLQIGAWLTSLDVTGLPQARDVGADYVEYWNGLPYTEVHAVGELLNGDGDEGYRAYSIYDHHLLARLMLIEFGTPDVQSQTVDGVKWNGTARIAYHGIHDTFGIPDPNGEYFWLDGMNMVDGTYHVLANNGSGNMIDTNIACPDDGSWLKNCLLTVLDDVDFGDLFIANGANNNNESAGSFGDRQSLNKNYAFCVNWQRSSRRGAFCLGGHEVNYTNPMLGWRQVRVV